MLLELGHDRGQLANSPQGPFRYNLRLLPLRPAVGVVSPGYLGILDEFPYWNAVFELYRKDEVKEAASLMGKIGIGPYGDYAIAGDIIYLEASTGEASEIIRLGDRLEVELIREELPVPFDELSAGLMIAYSDVRLAFGALALRVDTLVTLMIKGGQIPTAAWHEGYFTPKSEYGKICLPMPRELPDIVTACKRGLCYQLAFELSSGQAELWLLEASTVLAIAPNEPATTWLTEDQLNRALTPTEDGEREFERLAAARAQCHKLGRALIGRHSADRFVQCLGCHTEAFQSAGFGSVTHRAIKDAYGITVEELFKSARELGI